MEVLSLAAQGVHISHVELYRVTHQIQQRHFIVHLQFGVLLFNYQRQIEANKTITQKNEEINRVKIKELEKSLRLESANAMLLFAAAPFMAALLGWVVLRERVKEYPEVEQKNLSTSRRMPSRLSSILHAGSVDPRRSFRKKAADS